MNYEETTNRELNIKLASLLGLTVCEKKTNELDCMMNQLQRDFIDVDSDESIFANGKFIDYCTDWNATMPLAVEYELSIDPRSSMPKLGYIISRDDRIYAVDKSLLRAIVICLIKVLEAKQ